METRDQATWSISLGRWAGAFVQVHLFFAAFVLLTFVWAWFGPSGPESDLAANMGIATAGLVILLGSLLVHEFGHFLACHRAQGHVSSVMLMPWGGIDSAFLHSAQGRLLFYLAGPLANLTVAAACVVALRFGLEQSVGWELLNPLRPEWQLDEPYHLLAIKFIFWLNWVLFLVNMLPGLPFDGGHIVPALLRVVGPSLETIHIVRTSFVVSIIGAMTLLVMAFVMGSRDSNDFYPASMALLPLAVTLFFSARLYMQHPVDEPPHDWEYEEAFADDLHDASAFYDDDFFEQEEEESISDWLAERQLDRERHARQLEEEEEQRADEILAKLHEHGLESLSEEDRSVLQRVSARYRKRIREEA